jgi:alkanesulfonate monooxygenase SsuD/methylene tetrahydromethanopterin reductase-like flavin-dependent oxidoreductase (luciferase family)
MQLSITLEGHFGLTWPKWQQLTATIERMGFAGIFRSDHFAQPAPPDADALEAMVSLAYLASHSRACHFGTLVAPLSFRDPIMLARQAMAIDDLSGGRMILGVGAGWMEREHTMFGYPLGDVTTRLDRLEEGVAVIAALIRSPEPVTFAGQFYHLHEAQLLPRPQRPTPILIGGNGPKRILPLVARYADIWNALMISADEFAKRTQQLDDLLVSAGRQPTAVKRTIMLPVLCWRNEDELAQLAQGLRRAWSRLAPLTPAAIMSFLHEHFAGITGSPERVIEQILNYADVGVEEMMIQSIILDDPMGLEILREEVLPAIMRV